MRQLAAWSARGYSYLNQHPTLFSLCATVPLVILFIVEAFMSGLTQAELRFDQTLSAYASQTIAQGEGPYAGYILLHPPLAYMPGALTMTVGRWLNVPDELAVRYLFTALGAALIWLTYLIAVNLTGRRSVGLLAAAAVGWTALASLAAQGGKPQLITAFLGLLMVLALQKRRWTWAGALAGCAVMSYAAAVLVLPVLLLVSLAQDEAPRWQAVGRAGAGFLVALLILAIYLAAKGTLILLWQQYVVTLIQYVLNKALGTGLRDERVGLAHVIWKIQESMADRADAIVLPLGLAGLVTYMLYTWRASGRWAAAFISPRSSGVIFSCIVLLPASLFDFQSVIDLVPAIPYLAVLAGWLAWQIIQLWLRLWKRPSASYVKSAYALGLIVILSAARLQNVLAAEARSGLEAQRLAAAWLDATLGEDKAIQAWGDLSLLALAHRPNATRMIHWGPKSRLALESEGQKVENFFRQLDEIHPSLIFVDRRNFDYIANALNTSENYLYPFFSRILDRYEPVGYYSQNRIYASNMDAEAYLAAVGVTYAYDKPLLMEADRLVQEGHPDEAAAVYRQAADWAPDEAEPLIFLGDLYQERGEQALALEAYDAATQREQGTAWALLALGNRYASRGEDGPALRAYQAALPTSSGLPFPPEAPPALLPLYSLRQVGHPLGISVGKSLFILGYDIAPAQVTPGQPARLTLYWCSQDDAPPSGTLSLRWTTAAGKAIGAEHSQPMLWDPGYAVRWTYAVQVPENAQPGEPLQLKVHVAPDLSSPGTANEDQGPMTSAPFASIMVQPGN